MLFRSEPRVKVPPVNKFSLPNQVGKEHRTPNGGERFKGGYKGKNPRVKFNKASSLDDTASMKTMIVNNESTIDQSASSNIPFKSWGDLSEKPMVVDNEFLNTIAMNMLQENDIGLSEDENHFLDSQNPQNLPVQRSSDFANRFKTIQHIQELQQIGRAHV